MSHKSRHIFSLSIACVLLLQGIAEAGKPNVILMMADDLGFNDLSCYGSERQKTPILDRMAKEGIRLTSFYTGATVCSPSRMALLSGSYPTRLGWDGGVYGYGMKAYSGLSLDVVTIAEVFQAAGYRTAISGKWHIGIKELLPMNQGFESAYYIVASNNQTQELWRGDQLLNKKFDNKRFTETFTQEVIRFIDAKSDKPFFIYVPFTAPHFPAEAHPDWEGHSSNGAYGDVVEELDSRVGEILAALQRNKIDDNTLVVFLSDNGPEGNQSKFSSASPYGGRKWSAREGGTRVPCIIRWPGKVKAGRVTDAMTAAIDLMPTLAYACGIEIEIPQEGQKLDGLNVWESILGDDDQHPRTELLYWHGWGEAKAIRKDNWKLYFGEEKGVPGTNEGPALFNLEDDPSESNNVAGKHEAIVKEMLLLARTRLQDIHDHSTRIGAWEEAQWRIKDWQPKKKWGAWLK